jgi:hypothetical protein
VEETADLGDNLAALKENVLHLVAGHQVEISLAIANLGVFEPVPLGRRRSDGFGENHERPELDTYLSCFGREHCPADSDEIAEIKVPKDVELFVTENIFLRISLNASALVFDINEHAFAHVAVRSDAPGERDLATFSIIGAGLGTSFCGCELVFERVNSFGSQRRELGFALFDQ